MCVFGVQGNAAIALSPVLWPVRGAGGNRLEGLHYMSSTM